MEERSIFENSRSGDFSDMQRVEAAYRRWERDLSGMTRAALGRYAPKFCLGKSGSYLNLRDFTGSSDDFYNEIDHIMRRCYYQAETRRKYLGSLKRFLNWLTIPVNRVNNKCIYVYLESLLKEKVKAATYSVHLSALRTVFDCFCNLNLTNNCVLPVIKKRCLRKNIRLNEGDQVGSTENITAYWRGKVELILSCRHNIRDMALLLGLLLLDIKLNELLSIRKKDILLSEKEIIIWGGPGRVERKTELPDVLIRFFTARMNELTDGNYLFSSDRSKDKAITGQGANKIIQKMFACAGLGEKINCRILRQAEINPDNILSTVFLNKIFPEKTQLISQYSPPVSTVAHLKIKIENFIRYKGVVSADVELKIKGFVGEDISFNGIRISELSYRKPSIYFPYNEKWEKEFLWIPREVKERIIDVEFKDKISEVIIEKYLTRKQTCYIRRKRMNKNWRATA